MAASDASSATGSEGSMDMMRELNSILGLDQDREPLENIAMYDSQVHTYIHTYIHTYTHSHTHTHVLRGLGDDVQIFL